MRRPPCRVHLALLVVISLVLAPLGCRGRSPGAPPAANRAGTGQASLPGWAPKHPSPEFLRALKVLKPQPLASLRLPGATDAENAIEARQATIMWPAAYEFFGTLSDAQVERFLTSKQLLIPVQSLTPKQRRAFDKWANAWGEWRAGSYPDADFLVLLYKMGAKRDLSNVRVGFLAHSHIVGVTAHVTQPDGTTQDVRSEFALR